MPLQRINRALPGGRAQEQPGRPPAAGWLRLASLAAGLAVLTAGCSIKKMAVNKVGNALAGSGTTFSADDDPELVKAAVPFSLKLMESLLAESPRHKGLLFATASGFTQYAYAFVQQEADELEQKDAAAALAMRSRAQRLYLRARHYGLRGLEVSHPGFERALRAHPRPALRAAGRKDVPLLYWTAVSWAAAISVSKENPDLIADQPVAEALIDRALELDDAYDQGAIHSFLITYEMSRRGGEGSPEERARRHFARAVELSCGQQAGPYLALAEAVAVPKQNRPEFDRLLRQALAIDPDARPESRLVNLVMQRRARWLLSRADDLILPPVPANDPK
jgi:predicted anti-sigma-YlaC factor YlaD